MRSLLLAFLLLLLPAPLAAQAEPDWREGTIEHDVLLRPWAIEPGEIRLEAGRPARLHFVNQGQATHSFSAPAFFRAARLRPGDAELVTGGKLLLRPGERRTVVLIPAPGRYRARGGNLLHRLMGMSALIVVE